MAAAKKVAVKKTTEKKSGETGTEGAPTAPEQSGTENGNAAPGKDAGTAEKKPPAAPPALGVRGYRALSPVRANKQDFAEGEAVTGLSSDQAADLLALGVIEKK